MPDVHDPKTRSRNMAAIRGKDTKPEILIRKELHRRGFRYRLHDKKLPGRPDIVLPRYKAVIQVNGCFWHGHDCSLFKVPGTRADFWLDKIESNQQRDQNNSAKLAELGWREATIWECALKGRLKIPLREICQNITVWLNSADPVLNIAERSDQNA